MDSTLAVTTIVTVGLAFLGYLITYINNVWLSQRAARLERVNRQLAELYGPLFALTHASDSVWKAFISKYATRQTYFFGTGTPRTPEELEIWRLWITTVFAPINLRLYELVLSKSDLLVEAEMPDCLLKLCAHVASYEPVLKSWEAKDYTEHTSLLNYPTEPLIAYAESTFAKLKSDQAKLLGQKVAWSITCLLPLSITLS